MNRSFFGTGGALALGLGLPFSLFLVLNFMRPDLMRPMLDHVYGYVFVAVVTVLGVIASALYGFAFNVEFKTAAPRVVLILCAALFCTLPSIFLTLFGPIVFAFMFGGAP